MSLFSVIAASHLFSRISDHLFHPEVAGYSFLSYRMLPCYYLAS